MAGGPRHPKVLIVVGTLLVIVLVTVPRPVAVGLVVIGLVGAGAPFLARRRERIEASRRRTEAAVLAAARELGTRRGIVLVDGELLAAWMDGAVLPLPRDSAGDGGQ
jgi:hypothetical protein